MSFSFCPPLKAMLLLLSALVLLTQTPRSWGAEVTTVSQKHLVDNCTLAICSPVENGLPGRDGRDGREGPRSEKGDPGSPGARVPRSMLDVPNVENGSAGEHGTKGDSGPSGNAQGTVCSQQSLREPESSRASCVSGCGFPGPSSFPSPRKAYIAALRRQVEALQGQVGRLQGDFLQYKKVELFPNGRGVGQKVFKTAGFVKHFYEAQQVCAQAGGQLPSPRSAIEKEALQQLVEAEDKGAAFLSITAFWTEGTFTYPGGEPLVYSNWAPGEPNNDGGKEHCVEILANGKWNDIPCGAKRLVICEF
ncbi:hypothetical protein QTO34_006200 [Cnephaeus nilssonii]|uniref:C-type lectin domain-containing protein n=1 Tax=Cnephaeus nilssonii TaxID=3371016 RepID=A0AA40LIS9_CNENI|nr:hypothetical protein QTO34_006200 [Eptesicus nilssonii]